MAIEYFLGDEDVERNVLRQGDILINVHLVGALNLPQIGFTTKQTGEPASSWTVNTPPEIGPAMVISHSCEIDQVNGVKFTSVILAPLRALDGATPLEHRDKIPASNIIDPSNPEPSFLKYFWLPEHATLPFAGGSLVDFSKLFSVRNKALPYLVQRKVAQLTELAAASMALKLAYFFFRDWKAIIEKK